MADLTWHGPRVMRILREAGKEAVGDVAIEIQVVSKRLLAQAGTGRRYKKRGGRIHQASRPGEPPAIDLGSLVRSVQVELGEIDINLPRARVGTSLPYGRFLELGTRHIKRRPWLSVALKQVKPRVREIVRDVINRAMKVIRSLR